MHPVPVSALARRRSWFLLMALLPLACLAPAAHAQTAAAERMPLWPGPAPVGEGATEDANAFLTLHRPAIPNGTAVVICPGGGYGGLVTDGEGSGIARWLMLGFSTELPVLVTAQLLHAATFGCAHLGAMHFIQRAVPAGLSARAQGLYSAAALGVAPGLMSPFTGHLYEILGGSAFLVMAGLSALSALTAWRLMVLPVPPKAPCV